MKLIEFLGEVANVEDHYRESITSKDAYTRVGMRVKFANRSERAKEDQDMMMDDEKTKRVDKSGPLRRNKEADGAHVGSDSKAKVIASLLPSYLSL